MTPHPLAHPPAAAPTTTNNNNNGADDDDDDGGGGGKNESSASAAVTAPPPAPVPSPTGGVRTRAASDQAQQRQTTTRRLRQRHPPPQDFGRPSTAAAIRWQQTGDGGGSGSGRRRQFSQSLGSSYSHDDADAAAGITTIEMSPLAPRSAERGGGRGGQRGSSSEFFELQWHQQHHQHNQQHNQQHQQNQQRPPFAQRMERGINKLLLGGGDGNGGGGRAAYYGGSEHDFNDDYSLNSSVSASSSSVVVVAADGSTRRGRGQSPRPPPPAATTATSAAMASAFSPTEFPPTEGITADNGCQQHPQHQQHQRQQAPRARSYPPYDLPSIGGTLGTADGADDDDDDDGGVADHDPAAFPQSSSSSPPPPRGGGSFASGRDGGRRTAGDDDRNGKFKVLGWDLSGRSTRSRFLITSSGTFGFSLVYGYLQELISVTLCNRKLGLFLALAQFAGYTVLSYFFRRLDEESASTSDMRRGGAGGGGGGGGVGVGVGVGANNGGAAAGRWSSPSSLSFGGVVSLSRRIRRKPAPSSIGGGGGGADGTSTAPNTIPLEMYVGLSVLRAIDLGMTNLAMQYVNYPAKTIMKSTRVVFTMMFGVIVSKKRYGITDYCIVGIMVTGLAMFFHADANTSAVFNPLGIIMLTISLLCDGAISNLSEALMNQYEVGQDEYIFRLYSIATCFIGVAAGARGDLRDGIAFLTRPGTLKEIEEGLEPTWSVVGKVATIALLSLSGFLGSSCSAAITKSFGALTSSITSTARKATTIFLSFALFPNNKCTLEHVGGIFLFIASLVAKSLRHSKRERGGGHHHHHKHHHHDGRQYNMQHSLNNNNSVDYQLGRNGSIVIMDASKETAPLICGSPPYLRRKVGDESV